MKRTTQLALSGALAGLGLLGLSRVALLAQGQDRYVGIGYTPPPAASDRVYLRSCATEVPTEETIAQVNQELKQVVGNYHVMTRGAGTVQVPVYIHIIQSSTGAGDLTATQISAQIAVLNKAFSGTDTDRATGQTASAQPTANTPFRFVLAGVDRTKNDTWYTVGSGSAAESQMKNALRKGDARSLNIYFAKLPSGLLGWGTYPWGYASNPKNDGIVILTQTVPGGTAAPYNRGDTVTHETGHWLGLMHTFNAGCTTSNDAVGDTPAEKSPFFGQPLPYRDSCTTMTGRDPIENFMDYSNDVAMFQFTPGQAARADAMSITYRGL